MLFRPAKNDWTIGGATGGWTQAHRGDTVYSWKTDAGKDADFHGAKHVERQEPGEAGSDADTAQPGNGHAAGELPAKVHTECRAVPAERDDELAAAGGTFANQQCRSRGPKLPGVGVLFDVAEAVVR